MTRPLISPQAEEMFLRLAFCAALAEEAPEVLDDLWGLSEEKLNEWGRRWHIGAPWMIEHAKRTVGLGERYPDLPRLGLWMTPGGVAEYLPEVVDLVVRWDPSFPGGPVKPIYRQAEIISERTDEQNPDVAHVTTRPEHFEVTVKGASRKAAWNAAREAWTAYASEVENRYYEAGFTKWKHRTGGGNASIDERMRWLIWRKVREMTWSEIGKEAGRPWQTVRTAVKKLSPALGF